MILTCPQCQTRYQTDASHFAPAGRKVRCAKCGHIWHQESAAPEAEPQASVSQIDESQSPAVPGAGFQRSAFSPSPDISANEGEEGAPGRWATGIGVAAGWGALVAILLATGWSALNFRQEVAAIWPQSSSVYAALGMKVNARGLEFADSASRRETADGQTVLVVTGKLVNISAYELTVPPIRVTLTDQHRRVLYDWSFQTSVATLRPGQSVAFRTQMPSPPSTAKHLQLQLAERGE